MISLQELINAKQEAVNEKRRQRWSAIPKPQPICPYCNQNAVLVDSAVVYGRSFGFIWHCAPCDAYVGTHKNDSSHRPLGELANKELRGWRIKAHAAFDPIWQSGSMTRQDAYYWLCEKMGISKMQCHIGMFDIEWCKWVVRLCEQRKREGK